MPDSPQSALACDLVDTPARRPARRQGRVFNRTDLQRAIVEAAVIFASGRLLAMVAPGFWPPAVFPLILVLRLMLAFSPPVWAAARVVSTKREKMSRRFWKLGPALAAITTLEDAAFALFLGEVALFGGQATPPDVQRFAMHGPLALSPTSFLLGEVVTFGVLTVYYTIAVVSTRLANGGFMRFTMPAGNGRVTL